MTLRRRLWEDEVTKLLAAVAASYGVKGLEDYETPAERLAGSLASADGTPEREAEERRLWLVAQGDGDIEVA